MNKSEPFLPIIDLELCRGCGECVIVCPTGALTMSNGVAVLDVPDNCVYCADCEEKCPQGAIGLPYEIVLDDPSCASLSSSSSQDIRY